MERKRVYITVKTYPTISGKYAELVCTAGMLEDGSWVRLYPIPFRKLDFERKYKKYSWVELDVEKNISDSRIESYRPLNLDKMTIIEEPKLNNRKIDWEYRKKIVLGNKKIYTNMEELVSKAKNATVSLAVFKPTKITDFVIEETAREWDKNKLKLLEAEANQLKLFQTPEEAKREFSVVDKVPYKFSYKIEDDTGKASRMMIEDWEIGMLYFNCLRRADNDEKAAVEKVRQKYMDEFTQKDLYLFLGTTKQFHYVAPNPFVIVGVFYPPKEPIIKQMTLF